MNLTSDLLSVRILAPLARTLREATARLGLDINGEPVDDAAQAGHFAPDFAAAATTVPAGRAALNTAKSRASPQSPGGADSASVHVAPAATGKAAAPEFAAATAAPARRAAVTAAESQASPQFLEDAGAARVFVAAAATRAKESATATQPREASGAREARAIGDVAATAAPGDALGRVPGAEAATSSEFGHTDPPSTAKRELTLFPLADVSRAPVPATGLRAPGPGPEARQRVASPALRASSRAAAVQAPESGPREDAGPPTRAPVLASRDALTARAAEARTLAGALAGLPRADPAGANALPGVASPSIEDHAAAWDSAKFMLPSEIRSDSAGVAAGAIDIESAQAATAATPRALTPRPQGMVPVRRVPAPQSNADPVPSPRLAATAAPARLPATRLSAARRVAGALQPTLDLAYRITNRALAADSEGRADAQSEAAAELPVTPAPQVSNTFNVNVALRGEERPAATDREALRDGLVEVLRESARRQGLDV